MVAIPKVQLFPSHLDTAGEAQVLSVSTLISTNPEIHYIQTIEAVVQRLTLLQRKID